MSEDYDFLLIQALMSTAILPRQRLGIGAEMIATITIRGSSGRALVKGGSSVTASLTCNREECPVTDNGDGTYLVFVIPQGLGQHQLTIIVNDQHIKNSPFNLEIVPKRDYIELKHPLKSITGISTPRYIAFSNDGDAFITSSGQHCVHVYSKSGHKKNTIGWFGSGEVQFMNPFGIDIRGEVVYVAEYDGHRIHAFTIGGEFVGTFCEMIHGTGRFDYPRDIKVSPDGRCMSVTERTIVFTCSILIGLSLISSTAVHLVTVVFRTLRVLLLTCREMSILLGTFPHLFQYSLRKDNLSVSMMKGMSIVQ